MNLLAIKGLTLSQEAKVEQSIENILKAHISSPKAITTSITRSPLITMCQGKVS